MKIYIVLFLACSQAAAFGQSKTIHKSLVKKQNSFALRISGDSEREEINFQIASPEKNVTSDEPADNAAFASSENQQSSRFLKSEKSFSKEVRYNPACGELFLRYVYQKDGEEYEYERTVNARNKSESERTQIIEETEKALGLTTFL